MKDETSCFEGAHCTIAMERAAPRVLVVKLQGRDVDEFRDAPLARLESMFPASGAVDLFLDAKDVHGASIDVSGRWAHWLEKNRSRLASIRMLTRSPFVQLTAGFVRQFAGLGEQMYIYTDVRAFEEELGNATADCGSAEYRAT